MQGQLDLFWLWLRCDEVRELGHVTRILEVTNAHMSMPHACAHARTYSHKERDREDIYIYIEREREGGPDTGVDMCIIRLSLLLLLPRRQQLHRQGSFDPVLHLFWPCATPRAVCVCGVRAFDYLVGLFCFYSRSLLHSHHL